MKNEEKRYLLQDILSNSEKADSPKEKWISLATLLSITYFMCQSGAIMSYATIEWINLILKQKLVTNLSVSLDTSGCSSLNHTSELYKNLTKVQQQSAQWVMYNNVAEYALAFFTSLILTAYTDKYGRKFVIVTNLVGYLLCRALMLFVMYTSQNLIYIVLAYAIEGLTGAFFAFYSATFSMIADLVKDNKQRVLAVVSIEFISMLAVTISGFVSGILVEAIGYKYTTIICIGILVVALILAIFFLPESLKRENRTNPDSIFGILKRPFEFYTSSAFKGKRLLYILFVLAFGVAELAGLNRTSLETVYFLGAPFCWSPKKIGYFTSARHFGQGVIGLGSVKLMQRCWSNEFIAILSTVSGAASFIIEGLVTTDLMLFMVAVVAVLSFLTIPMIRGIMSTLTPPDKQGSMFASLAAIQVIGSIIAVTTENNIYSATVSIMNGFVFLVMAGFCTLEFMLLIFAALIKRRDAVVVETTLVIGDQAS